MNIIKDFGKYVLDDAKLKKYMSPLSFASYKKLKAEGAPLSQKTAKAVAKAIKKWAICRGATHYTHWFMPLNGTTAEKQISFVETKNNKIVTDFSAKDLIKGETDASSFPSGGERQTFEARGYTVWDYTSPVFIKEDAEGNKVVYIPTAFCSYSGVALDEKTPLLRALEKLSHESTRIMHAMGYNSVKKVNLMTGIEQEYFLVRTSDFVGRTDLKVLGRTLFGASPLKSQELCSHYYGKLDNIISAFMNDVDRSLWKMGVTAKMQHCEVAPNQFEFVPIFSPANIASDQNQLIMQVISSMAHKYDLNAIFAEKPFAYINGSGKHANWSLNTDTGINLFDSKLKDKQLFYTFFVAVIEAIDRYNKLIKLSASSRENDLRLGGNEAPPQIVSVYVGDELVNELESFGTAQNNASNMFVSNVKTLPTFAKDTSDRNRTSPFAYTGKKFEFRMIGSSMSVAFPTTCICACLAKVLKEYADKIENEPEKRKILSEIVQNSFKNHKRIVFNGNNYSDEWKIEAKKRGIKEYTNAADSFEILSDEDIVELFESTKILSKTELSLRKATLVQEYLSTVCLEAKTMLHMTNKEILPSVALFKDYIVGANMTDTMDKATPLFDELYSNIYALESAIQNYEKSKTKITFAKVSLLQAMANLRKTYDSIEELLPASLEPFPTYTRILN